MNNQASHAMNPENPRPRNWTTAAALPIVAMLPLSKYRNGPIVLPASLARMTRAA